MTKYAARGMIKRRWGASSTSERGGAERQQGAVHYSLPRPDPRFTKSVAKELASRNVLVNAVAPGYVETELTQGIFPGSQAVLPGQHSAGTVGQGSDIAGAVLFLASDLASYITGRCWWSMAGW